MMRYIFCWLDAENKSQLRSLVKNLYLFPSSVVDLDFFFKFGASKIYLAFRKTFCPQTLKIFVQKGEGGGSSGLSPRFASES